MPYSRTADSVHRVAAHPPVDPISPARPGTLHCGSSAASGYAPSASRAGTVCGGPVRSPLDTGWTC